MPSEPLQNAFFIFSENFLPKSLTTHLRILYLCTVNELKITEYVFQSKATSENTILYFSFLLAEAHQAKASHFHLRVKRGSPVLPL